MLALLLPLLTPSLGWPPSAAVATRPHARELSTGRCWDLAVNHQVRVTADQQRTPFCVFLKPDFDHSEVVVQLRSLKQGLAACADVTATDPDAACTANGVAPRSVGITPFTRCTGSRAAAARS